jgi:hypothetical protein
VLRSIPSFEYSISHIHQTFLHSGECGRPHLIWEKFKATPTTQINVLGESKQQTWVASTGGWVIDCGPCELLPATDASSEALASITIAPKRKTPSAAHTSRKREELIRLYLISPKMPTSPPMLGLGAVVRRWE